MGIHHRVPLADLPTEQPTSTSHRKRADLMGDRLAFYPAMSAPRRRRRGTGDGGGDGESL